MAANTLSILKPSVNNLTARIFIRLTCSLPGVCGKQNGLSRARQHALVHPSTAQSGQLARISSGICLSLFMI